MGSVLTVLGEILTLDVSEVGPVSVPSQIRKSLYAIQDG